MPAPTPISSERLETLLQQRSDLAQRPRATPREVLAKWLDNLGVGVGVGVGAAVLLWLVRAPDSALLAGSGAIGLLAFAVMMAWRGSEDERNDRSSTRNVRRQVAAMQQECNAQVRILRQQLDAAFDEIETLEKALDRITSERNNAILEKKRALEQAQTANTRTFVRASNTEPQVVMDAHEMLRFWFESGGTKWYSRNVANQFGWSDKRHRAAQQLLVDSGVLVINEKRPRVMEESLSAAIHRLNDHMTRVDSVYLPSARAAISEEEY